MNEDGLIEALRARLAGDDPRVVVGIGDDAAVLATLAGQAVVSVDAQVEGVHFDRRWLETADVAHRGISAALSDLAAMGAEATAVLVSWELPAGEPEAGLRGLVDGLAEASRDYRVPIVGGNVARGPALSQHTTVIGEVRRAATLRSGAKPGDGVFVSGPLGTAAVGLRALMAGENDAFAQRWRRPTARLDLARLIAAQASACVDISDGLGSELTHLARASGVGARVELARVPTAPGQAERARALGHDPEALVVAGGEDYELLFTSIAPVDPRLATRVGEITDGDVEIVRADGARWSGERGFRHR